MDIDQYSFTVGFAFGFLFSGVLGWILQRMRQAWHGMGAPDRPMNVETPHTPRWVMARAAAALWRLMGLLVLLLLTLGAGGWLLYQLLATP
jgi:hypothetical protein